MQNQTQNHLTMKLLNFTKIEHTVFSLPMLFAGAYLGWQGSFVSMPVLGLIIAAAFGARIFGMTLNRIFDRHLDALNPRTQVRELPSGALSLKIAIVTAIVGLSIYFISCIALGGWCLILSPLPLIPLAGYSLLKRFTSFCHFGIGFCLALAPLSAFVAASDSISVTGSVLWFSLFVFFWMSGADMIYAMLDIDSDRKTGVYSMPARLGEKKAQILATMLHLCAAGCIGYLYYTIDGGVLSRLSLVISLIMFILMQIPKIPAGVRFFPISSLAGIAGAFVIMTGSMF